MIYYSRFIRRKDREKYKEACCSYCGILLTEHNWNYRLYNSGSDFDLHFCGDCLPGRTRFCACGRRYHTAMYESYTIRAKDLDSHTTIDVYLSDIIDFGNRGLCPRCELSYVIQCPDCLCYFSRNPYNSSVQCSSCRNFQICNSCNRRVLKSRFNSFEDNVCLDCSPVYKILEWDKKPKVHIWTKPKSKNALLFGIEIEVHSPNHDYEELVHKLWKPQKGSTKRFYFKWDGTIQPGFELVFQPMDWYKLTRYNWDWVFDLEQYRTNNHPAEGIHIHLSRRNFTPFHSFKFSNFIYNNLTLIIFISERVPNKYCSPDLDISLSRAVREEVGCTHIHGGNHDLYNFKRRRLVNHINKNTIELRGFRTHLKPTNFWKNLEFVKALYEFTKSSSLSAVTTEEFLDYISQNSKQYPNLSTYLEGFANYASVASMDHLIPRSKIYNPVFRRATEAPIPKLELDLLYQNDLNTNPWITTTPTHEPFTYDDIPEDVDYNLEEDD